MTSNDHPVWGISCDAASFFDEVRKLTACAERILPPVDVLHRCQEMAAASPSLLRSVLIGETESGKPIHAYECGENQNTVLLYGFPDPGEAIGGTAIVCLLQALVESSPFLQRFDVAWRFIPCLNVDDQPDEGRTLRPVMKNEYGREVDWCLQQPRQETTALVEYAKRIKPAFSFPLHDEYHCGEPLDAYFGVVGHIPDRFAIRIREYVRRFGVPVSAEVTSATWGDGFFEFHAGCQDYGNSTFSLLAQTGPVFIAEVSKRPELSPADTVALQLGTGLIAMSSVVAQ